jgi:hypothetical protein
MNGIIMAAGVIRNYAMQKAEALALADDIYGPIRPARRVISKAGAADTSDVEFAATPTQAQPYPEKYEAVAY